MLRSRPGPVCPASTPRLAEVAATTPRLDGQGPEAIADKLGDPDPRRHARVAEVGDEVAEVAGYSRKSRSFCDREGWRSLERVFDSIWRILSRGTPNSRPT